MGVRILVGDALEQMALLADGSVNCVITDPPYGETSLKWDRWVDGWLAALPRIMAPSASLWCFGSLRFFIERAADFKDWNLAQDLVWEKHNGSNAFADRFRRVHEQAAQFYPPGRAWSDIYRRPLFTNDATARTVRRKRRPPQWGHIEASAYASEDGGPRLMRSVMFARSAHGYAVHPTQKPLETILPLDEYSCPVGGVVLDCFMGSGTVGVAAQRLGRGFIGIEIDPAYCTAAERRIEADAGLFASIASD
jgi:site-specific DNA-methyltransferase (adenine-specific)